MAPLDWVTCCRRLAGKNTCSFAEIILTSNFRYKYSTDIDTGLRLRYTVWAQLQLDYILSVGMTMVIIQNVLKSPKFIAYYWQSNRYLVYKMKYIFENLIVSSLRQRQLTSSIFSTNWIGCLCLNMADRKLEYLVPVLLGSKKRLIAAANLRRHHRSPQVYTYKDKEYLLKK